MPNLQCTFRALRLQRTFLSQSCIQQLCLGIISISNSIFSCHLEGIHRSHGLSIIHFQIHREAKKILHGEIEKRCLHGKPRDVFPTSMCCSSKSCDKFSSKTTFASITGSNFQIRCLGRECMETHSTEKSFTKRSLIQNPKLK